MATTQRISNSRGRGSRARRARPALARGGARQTNNRNQRVRNLVAQAHADDHEKHQGEADAKYMDEKYLPPIDESPPPSPRARPARPPRQTRLFDVADDKQEQKQHEPPDDCHVSPLARLMPADTNMKVIVVGATATYARQLSASKPTWDLHFVEPSTDAVLRSRFTLAQQTVDAFQQSNCMCGLPTPLNPNFCMHCINADGIIFFYTPALTRDTLAATVSQLAWGYVHTHHASYHVEHMLDDVTLEYTSPSTYVVKMGGNQSFTSDRVEFKAPHFLSDKQATIVTPLGARHVIWNRHHSDQFGEQLIVFPFDSPSTTTTADVTLNFEQSVHDENHIGPISRDPEDSDTKYTAILSGNIDKTLVGGGHRATHSTGRGMLIRNADGSQFSFVPKLLVLNACRELAYAPITQESIVAVTAKQVRAATSFNLGVHADVAAKMSVVVAIHRAIHYDTQIYASAPLTAPTAIRLYLATLRARASACRAARDHDGYDNYMLAYRNTLLTNTVYLPNFQIIFAVAGVAAVIGLIVVVLYLFRRGGKTSLLSLFKQNAMRAFLGADLRLIARDAKQPDCIPPTLPANLKNMLHNFRDSPALVRLLCYVVMARTMLRAITRPITHVKNSLAMTAVGVTNAVVGIALGSVLGAKPTSNTTLGITTTIVAPLVEELAKATIITPADFAEAECANKWAAMATSGETKHIDYRLLLGASLCAGAMHHGVARLPAAARPVAHSAWNSFFFLLHTAHQSAQVERELPLVAPETAGSPARRCDARLARFWRLLEKVWTTGKTLIKKVANVERKAFRSADESLTRAFSGMTKLTAAGLAAATAAAVGIAVSPIAANPPLDATSKAKRAETFVQKQPNQLKAYGPVVDGLRPTNIAANSDNEYNALLERLLRKRPDVSEDLFLQLKPAADAIIECMAEEKDCLTHWIMPHDKWVLRYPAQQRKLFDNAREELKSGTAPPKHKMFRASVNLKQEKGGYSMTIDNTVTELSRHNYCVSQPLITATKPGRVIVAFTPYVNTIMGPTQATMKKAIQQSLAHTPLVYAPGHNGYQLGRRFQDFLDEHPSVTIHESDVSKMDAHVNEHLSRIAKLFWRHFGYHKVSQYGKRMSYWYKQVDRVGGFGLCGTRFSFRHRTPSGIVYTTDANTLIMMVVLLDGYAHAYNVTPKAFLAARGVPRTLFFVGGDDSLVMVAEANSPKPTKRMSESGLPFKTATPTPDTATFLSGRFWPATVNVGQGPEDVRILGPKAGRVVFRLGWFVQPPPVEPKSLVRGSALGLIAYDFVPGMGEFLQHCLSSTEGHAAVAPKDYNPYVHSKVRARANSSTWGMAAALYGLNRQNVHEYKNNHIPPIAAYRVSRDIEGCDGEPLTLGLIHAASAYKTKTALDGAPPGPHRVTKGLRAVKKSAKTLASRVWKLATWLLSLSLLLALVSALSSEPGEAFPPGELVIGGYTPATTREHTFYLRGLLTPQHTPRGPMPGEALRNHPEVKFMSYVQPSTKQNKQHNFSSTQRNRSQSSSRFGPSSWSSPPSIMRDDVAAPRTARIGRGLHAMLRNRTVAVRNGRIAGRPASAPPVSKRNSTPAAAARTLSPAVRRGTLVTKQGAKPLYSKKGSPFEDFDDWLRTLPQPGSDGGRSTAVPPGYRDPIHNPNRKPAQLPGLNKAGYDYAWDSSRNQWALHPMTEDYGRIRAPGSAAAPATKTGSGSAAAPVAPPPPPAPVIVPSDAPSDLKLAYQAAGVSYARNFSVRAPHMREGTRNYGGKLRNSLVVRHREPIKALPGSAAYSVDQQLLNPSNGTLFPWLSTLAGNFDLFYFSKCSLIFITENPTSVKGRILLGADYDVTDSLPASRTQFETLQGTKAVVDWKDARFDVNIPATKHQNFFFVSPASSGDPRVTYQSRLQWATMDFPDTTTAGELWIEYTVELLMSTSSAITSLNGPAIFGYSSAAQSGATVSSNMLTASAIGLASNGNISLQAGTGTVASTTAVSIKVMLPAISTVPLQWIPQSGSWLIAAYVYNTTSAGTPVVPVYNNCTNHSYSLNGFSGAINSYPSVFGAVANMIYRVDTTSAVVSSQPYVEIALTGGTASTFTGMMITVASLTQGSGGLSSQRGETKDDTFTVYRRDVVRSVDGKTTYETVKNSQKTEDDKEVIVTVDPQTRQQTSDVVRQRAGSTDSLVTVSLPRALAAAMSKDEKTPQPVSTRSARG